MSLVANKDILGGTWQVSARDIRSVEGKFNDWYSPVRHETGVMAINAGRAWAEMHFG